MHAHRVLSHATGLVLALVTTAQQKSPFTYQDLLMLDRISGLAVDPAGTTALFNVRATDMEKNRGVSTLWMKDLVDLKKPEAKVPAGEGGASDVQWAADGSGFFFLSARGEVGTTQVWKADAKGTTATQVTRLPLDVRRLGVTVNKGSTSFLQVLAFYSPDGRHDQLTISNYITLNVLDELKRVPGTTNVQIFGAKDYAMRVWLKPDRMTQLKVTPTDLIAALNEQNAQFAVGKVGQSPTAGPQELVYTVTTKGRLSDPREFENVIIRANPDGSIIYHSGMNPKIQRNPSTPLGTLRFDRDPEPAEGLPSFGENFALVFCK